MSAGELTRDGLQLLDASTVVRDALVTPGICGPAAFVGQLGDWTWETVTALCDVDVFTARNAAGEPAYLSFHYIRVRGSRALHLGSLAFGDRLRVTSSLFDFGSEAILTLHTVRMSGSGAPAGPVDPVAFYAGGDPDVLYAEVFNRWVSRGSGGGNEGLVRSSPPGFRHSGLPKLSAAHSPRAAYGIVRSRLSFLGEAPAGRRCTAGTIRLEYPIDVARDINGVGLLYFVAYFSIVDWALFRHWGRLGRTAAQFLNRVVVDQRMCYLSNADPESVLTIDVTAWSLPGAPGDEIVEVVLRNRADGRPVAVSAVHLLPGADS
jgi:probable biosynthetic protein (TIGR04098 family)